ncbi:hypothetical protein QJS10_CPA10g00410 [Acorus calamus]|uniref:MPN domain-containing protein n=1 Tax=Acorus calamus TaxID=4465 RepID=A0AAV9DWZ9_ACOCL|nr:hypothetical protein QJS10_CPA10g00410 [Acorus calamus]
MTQTTGRTTRVIGWYHSHPHITVLPSHVDVRTQAMYQLLDSGFIGLIFSCFNQGAQKVGRIQVIAFQSLDGKQKQLPRSVPVSTVVNSSIIDVESSSWSSSENVVAMSGYAQTESLEKDTGDSRSAKAMKGTGRSSDLEDFFSHANVNHLGKEKMGGDSALLLYNPDNLDNSAIDIDPMDMTESMQEAMHRSNLDMSGAEYIRKEVQLQVLPACSLLKLGSGLTSFVDVQRVLFEEERTAYNQALLHNTRNGKLHPLAFIHHTSTYQASLCKLMEYCLSPAITALQDRLKENEIRLAMLMEEQRALEIEALKRGSDKSLGSPQHTPSRGLRTNLPGQRDPYGSTDPTIARSGSSRSRKAS